MLKKTPVMPVYTIHFNTQLVLHVQLIKKKISVSNTPSVSIINEKSAQRDANTARKVAVVRFGHRPPAVTNPQTGPITIHCAAAS